MLMTKTFNRVSYTDQIFETNDYSLFKYINANRDIDLNHIKFLKTQYEMDKTYLKEHPIRVYKENGYLHIKDGQHRFYLCSENNYTVYYKIVKNKEILAIAKEAAGQKRWVNNDYIKLFSMEGNENFTKLRNLMSEYDTSCRIIFNILQGQDWSKYGTKSIQNGSFTITDDQITKVRSTLIKIHDIISRLNISGNKSFMYAKVALIRIIFHKDYDHSRMIHKLKTFPTFIKSCVTTTEWISQFIDLYNYKAKEENKIHLEYGQKKKNY